MIAGLTLAALGAYITSTATDWDILASDGPGPGFFPMVYGVIMFGASLVLIVSAYRRPAEDDEPVDWAGVGRALGAWSSLVFMIPIMKNFGFAIAFAALLVFFGRVVFKASWRLTLICAVLVPLGFQILFPTLLQVQLPVGLLTGF